MTTFSFIIVNYNTKEALRRCLLSVVKFCSSDQIEVIVIDNNSQDGSQNMLKHNFYNQVNFVFNSSNLGFSKACNQGASLARGKYLFFLNSDAYLTENILTKVEEIFKVKESLNLVALSPVIKDEKGKLEPRFFGDFPNLFSIFFQRGKKNISENDLNSKLITEVDWLSGAALIIKKSAFFSVEGFDKNFFMYFEDIDLAKKLRKLGYILAVCPLSLSVIHQRGLSLKNKDKLRKKYYYQSQDYYFKKYYGLLSLYLLRLFRFFYITLFK
ncbi:MAG: glycosyltransferase family 2 protein [Candidatus Pacebacteria bacterium]|nr:glycosyltransferase family 2 protein [Candidatus Paceibacterota bacterium]